MKKLLGILVLGLLWCNVGVAKDLSGLILSCGGSDEGDYPKEPKRWNHLNIKFLSSIKTNIIRKHENQ